MRLLKYLLILVAFIISQNVFGGEVLKCNLFQGDELVDCIDDIYDESEFLASYSGDSGSINTLPFIADGPWVIFFNLVSTSTNEYKFIDNLTVSLMSQDGKIITNVLMQNQEGVGVSYMPKKGTFYLNIVSTGIWNVTILPYK